MTLYMFVYRGILILKLVNLNNKDIVYKIIYGILSILIIFFIFRPVASVVLSSIYREEAFDIYRYLNVRTAKLLGRSIFVASLVTLISTIFGFILAFTLNRINFTGKSIIKLLSIFPLISPPFVGSIAFIMLFGKRGLISHKLLGLTVSPFGWPGIVTMQALSLTTLAYIMISSSLKRLDPSMEEASRNLGASELKVFFTVTLPLMLPEISSAALLVFLGSMADFGTPIIIGGSFQTLASDIYIQVIGLYDMKSAAISGVILLIPCLIVFIVQKYLISNKSFITGFISSDDVEHKNISSPVKYSLIAISSLFACMVFLKYGFIILGAFTKLWGYDYTFTIEHLKEATHINMTPLKNSVKLSIVTAFFSSYIGILTSYILYRKKFFGSKVIDFLATLPGAVPGILFGIGYLITFSRKPVILIGTVIVVYIICIFRYIPVTLRAGYALLDHINPDLESASLNLGATEINTFFKITLPLLKPAYIAGFLKTFSNTMTTLGAIIFLIIPKTKVATQVVFQVISSSEIGKACALAVTIFFISLLFLGLFNLFFNFGSFKSMILGGRNNACITKRINKKIRKC